MLQLAIVAFSFSAHEFLRVGIAVAQTNWHFVQAPWPRVERFIPSSFTMREPEEKTSRSLEAGN